MKATLAIIELFRPLQWIKNIVVLAAIFFSGMLLQPQYLLPSLTAFILFCLISSAIYCINDIADLVSDREHPIKKRRPLASGRLSTSTAMICSLVLIAVSLSSAFLFDIKLFMVLGAYFLLNCLYSFFLKTIVLVDIFCIAFAFLLRILAGSWAIDIEPSQWFILCTFMLSLYLGFCKRYSELIVTSTHEIKPRKVLTKYSPIFLQILIGACMSATLITYGLYTVSERTMEVHHTSRFIYSFPIVAFGLFRYTYLILYLKGFGEDTARDLIKDIQLIATVVVYIASIFVLIV
ncbi:decaprenyl-phosphate phosphoribosyltransferase [Fibrobacterota bacterium]